MDCIVAHIIAGAQIEITADIDAPGNVIVNIVMRKSAIDATIDLNAGQAGSCDLAARNHAVLGPQHVHAVSRPE